MFKQSMANVSKVSREERIRAQAYELFLQRGGVHGHAMEDWCEAERLIDLEDARGGEPLAVASAAATAAGTSAAGTSAVGGSAAGAAKVGEKGKIVDRLRRSLKPAGKRAPPAGRRRRGAS